MKKHINNRKIIPMFISLCLVIALVSALVLRGDTYDTSYPAVTIRHEHVTSEGNTEIYRMVVSARAPEGFNLFGIVISYDDRHIRPVDSLTYLDFEPPAHTSSDTPFNMLINSQGHLFSQVPDVWLTQSNRTGFSFDMFSLGEGITSYGLTDVFGFYYRLIGSAADADFRIEDGRAAGSMVGTHFVRPGVKMQSGGTTFIWGPHTNTHADTEIPDANIDLGVESEPEPELTADPEADPEPTPGISPSPSPSPSRTPDPASSPSPSPVSTPGQSPSPTPGVTSTPSPTQTPYTAGRPNPDTNDPTHISFMAMGAITLLGVSAFSIIMLARKQTLVANQYETDITRHKREQRLEDLFEE